MTPEETRQLVRQEIQQSTGSSQFNLNRIPFHTHNGKDSPFNFTPTLTYGGLVNADGTISRLYPFPSGWKHGRLTGSPTGVYLIEHDFNSTFYVVNVTPIASSKPAAYFVTNLFPNTFEVHIFDSLAQTLLDSAFYFTVLHVTNTKPGWPLYNKNAT